MYRFCISFVVLRVGLAFTAPRTSLSTARIWKKTPMMTTTWRPTGINSYTRHVRTTYIHILRSTYISSIFSSRPRSVRRALYKALAALVFTLYFPGSNTKFPKSVASYFNIRPNATMPEGKLFVFIPGKMIYRRAFIPAV